MTREHMFMTLLFVIAVIALVVGSVALSRDDRYHNIEIYDHDTNSSEKGLLGTVALFKKKFLRVPSDDTRAFYVKNGNTENLPELPADIGVNFSGEKEWGMSKYLAIVSSTQGNISFNIDLPSSATVTVGIPDVTGSLLKPIGTKCKQLKFVNINVYITQYNKNTVLTTNPHIYHQTQYPTLGTMLLLPPLNSTTKKWVASVDSDEIITITIKTII